MNYVRNNESVFNKTNKTVVIVCIAQKGTILVVGRWQDNVIS